MARKIKSIVLIQRRSGPFGKQMTEMNYVELRISCLKNKKTKQNKAIHKNTVQTVTNEIE